MMTAVLAIWAVGIAFALWVSMTWRRRWDVSKAAPLSRDTARSPMDGVASTNGERCLLCNGRLPSHLATRAEVIARIEHRIRVDSTAVAQLLASPPSDAWVHLFHP